MSQHDDSVSSGTARELPSELDLGVPQSARIYDYWLGGKDNFAADRAVAEALAGQIPTIRVMVRSQRVFLARAVEYLVRVGGIRQFLDIGTGIPSENNVHEVAQHLAPECRVLYVDNDPVVLAHARARMTSTPEGKTAFIPADLREPEKILSDATLRATLNLDQPVALLLIGVLHHLREADDPYRIVATLLDALPSGSYFALTQPTADFDPEAMAGMAATAEQSGIPYVPRSRDETEVFFTGLELVEPGLVPIPAWNPLPREEETTATLSTASTPDPYAVYGWAGVARKP
ncbi:MAG: SAM-dependent methyltransferase [Actinomycetota bacterium]|nr:SAM-dependent methyltransferase [Actinomycetota bacterium]